MPTASASPWSVRTACRARRRPGPGARPGPEPGPTGATGHRVRPGGRRRGRPDGVDLVPTGQLASLPANGSVAPVTLSLRAVSARPGRRDGRFDVVHVHEPFTPGLPYGLLVGAEAAAPGGHLPPQRGERLLHALRPLARRLAAGSPSAARCPRRPRATARRPGRAPSRWVQRRGGRPVPAVDPWPTDRPTVLFLGRHEERKGLACPARRLRPAGQGPSPVRGPRAGRPVLWIAGDGPETDALRRLHPESDIQWLGVLSEEEKVRRLVAADVALRAVARWRVLRHGPPRGHGGPDGGGGQRHRRLPGRGRRLRRAGATGRPRGAGRGARPSSLDRRDRGRRRRRAGRADRLAGRGAAWAERWSMERLADWYEEHYRVGRGPARR